MALKLEKHEKRDEIATAYREGVSLRAIASQYEGVTKEDVDRYGKRLGLESERNLAVVKRECPMEKKILIPSVDPEEVERVDFLADLYRIRRDLMALQGSEDPRIGIQALDKQIKLIDTLVKVAAELREQRKDDLMSNPEFRRYEDTVLEVLKEYPGAIERLRDLLGSRRIAEEANPSSFSR